VLERGTTSPMKESMTITMTVEGEKESAFNTKEESEDNTSAKAIGWEEIRIGFTVVIESIKEKEKR
jgi:hypothetical protein